MSAGQSASGYVQLRYETAKVFQRADARTSEVGELRRGDVISVLGFEGEFYQVELPDGTTGFVDAHNLVGPNLPLTAMQQETAIRGAAEASFTGGGWRGILRRRLGR